MINLFSILGVLGVCGLTSLPINHNNSIQVVNDENSNTYEFTINNTIDNMVGSRLSTFMSSDLTSDYSYFSEYYDFNTNQLNTSFTFTRVPGVDFNVKDIIFHLYENHDFDVCLITKFELFKSSSNHTTLTTLNIKRYYLFGTFGNVYNPTLYLQDNIDTRISSSDKNLNFLYFNTSTYLFTEYLILELDDTEYFYESTMENKYTLNEYFYRYLCDDNSWNYDSSKCFDFYNVSSSMSFSNLDTTSLSFTEFKTKNLDCVFTMFQAVPPSSVYNDGYNNGFNDGTSSGYQTGYRDGVIYGETVDDTALTIFTGIVDIGLLPVNVFLAMLNFEVFGINIGGLVSSLMTVAVGLILWRVVMGGNSGQGGKK